MARALLWRRRCVACADSSGRAGLLTRKELHEIYRTSLAAAGEPHDEDSVKEMVNSLFSTMDTNGDSAISRDGTRCRHQRPCCARANPARMLLSQSS